MGTLIPYRQRAERVRAPRARPLEPPRQLDLVFDDARLTGLTAIERQSALQALAHLLLEASGVATREDGHDQL